MYILQWVAAIFYLLNKVFLSFSEHARENGNEARRQQWRVISWIVYLIGLPAWVVIFIQWHNWIAASVEASGTPAMILGLVTALKGQEKKPPRWLDRLAKACIPLGFAISLYDFGGLTTFNQALEIGLVTGFLIGTYRLAKEQAGGYLWYVIMHVCCGWLMYIQSYPWLLAQQVASLLFIIDAYRTAQRIKRKNQAL